MTNNTVKACTLGVQSPSLHYCCSSYTVNSEMCITSTISVLVLPSLLLPHHTLGVCHIYKCRTVPLERGLCTRWTIQNTCKNGISHITYSTWIGKGSILIAYTLVKPLKQKVNNKDTTPVNGISISHMWEDWVMNAAELLYEKLTAK